MCSALWVTFPPSPLPSSGTGSSLHQTTALTQKLAACLGLERCLRAPKPFPQPRVPLPPCRCEPPLGAFHRAASPASLRAHSRDSPHRSRRHVRHRPVGPAVVLGGVIRTVPASPSPPSLPYPSRIPPPGPGTCHRPPQLPSRHRPRAPGPPPPGRAGARP